MQDLEEQSACESLGIALEERAFFVVIVKDIQLLHPRQKVRRCDEDTPRHTDRTDDQPGAFRTAQTQGNIEVFVDEVDDAVFEGDQRRVATPDMAIRAGADYLVVGRPINAAADPKSGKALRAAAKKVTAKVRRSTARKPNIPPMPKNRSSRKSIFKISSRY